MDEDYFNTLSRSPKKTDFVDDSYHRCTGLDPLIINVGKGYERGHRAVLKFKYIYYPKCPLLTLIVSTTALGLGTIFAYDKGGSRTAHARYCYIV